MASEPRTIVYSFATPHRRQGQTLYVNAVTKYSCVNSCRFCSRIDAIKGKPNIYERKAGSSLFLKEPPLPEDIRNEVKGTEAEEIAFVGLGEPLLNFQLVRSAIRGIRADGFAGKIAIDTNGLVKCWYDSDPAKELKEAGLDEIRISVNAINSDDYSELCRPVYSKAFQMLCEFVRDCLKEGLDVFASFVTGFDDGRVRTRSATEYRSFALSLGVENTIIREYVKPISEHGKTEHSK